MKFTRDAVNVALTGGLRCILATRPEEGGAARSQGSEAGFVSGFHPALQDARTSSGSIDSSKQLLVVL